METMLDAVAGITLSNTTTTTTNNSSTSATSTMVNSTTTGSNVFGMLFTSNSAPTTTTSTTTLQVYDRLLMLNTDEKIIFTTIFALCLFVGCVVNLIVTFAIKKTEQWKNQSTFLIMLLSINEAMSSLFNNVMYIIFLWFFQHLDFKVGLILKTISHLFSYVSSMLVCAIGFDRFMRVLYTSRYKTVFTTTKYRLFLTVTFGLATIQTTLNLIGPLYFGEGYGGMLTAPINCLLFVMTLILYFICICRLKSYSRESRTISMENRSLIKMAVIYMSLFGISHTPPVVYSVCYKSVFIRYKLSDRFVGILTCIVFLCMNANTIVNAVVFMIINKKARKAVTGSQHDNVTTLTIKKT